MTLPSSPPTANDAAALDAEISLRGWGVRPFLPPDVLAAVRARFDALEVPPGPEMFRAFADQSRSEARTLDVGLKELLAPHLSRYLPGRLLTLATFIHKGPGGEALDYHQDWTFTDERQARAVLAWIPLIDVDATNGALAMIDGSHRWTDHLRTSSDERTGPANDLQAELHSAATPLVLRAGEAVVYDAATVHGSAPNASTVGRPALALLTLPEGAPVVHFWERHDGSVEGFHVDEAFFTTVEFETRPTQYGPYEPWAGPVTAADLAAGLAGRTSPSASTATATATPTSRRRWLDRFR